MACKVGPIHKQNKATRMKQVNDTTDFERLCFELCRKGAWLQEAASTSGFALIGG